MTETSSPDPLWQRVGDVIWAVAAVAANMLSDAVEDGARRVFERIRWTRDDRMSKRDLRRGRYKQFSNANDAIAWLNRT